MSDGGPAFPFSRQGPTTAQEIYSGISIRDYFASQALIGLLHHYHGDATISPNPLLTISETAYKYADAMLAERENAAQLSVSVSWKPKNLSTTNQNT